MSLTLRLTLSIAFESVATPPQPLLALLASVYVYLCLDNKRTNVSKCTVGVLSNSRVQMRNHTHFL